MSAFCFQVVSSPYMSTLKSEKDKKMFGKVQQLEEMEHTNIPFLHCYIVEMVGLNLYIICNSFFYKNTPCIGHT